MADPDLAAQDVISAFGSFCWHGLVAALWADQRPPAWNRRDEGFAIGVASSRR